MIQVTFQALGGQGAKSAADILAEAAFAEGKEMQAFPEFGPERRGTPMRAYVRIDGKKITTHEPITSPDYTIVIDQSLAVKERLNGICIVNSAESGEQIKRRTGFDGEIHTVDASKLGQFANLPMLAAFVKVSRAVKMETVITRAEALFGKKLGDERMKQAIDGMRKAYEAVV